MAAAVVLAAIVVAAVAGPIVHAVAELLRLVAIVLAAALGLVLVGLMGFLCYRWRRRRASTALPVPAARPVPWQAAQAVSEPRRQAIEAPGEVHIHIHGVTAEDVSAILGEVNRDRG
jgi:hypothetical protein